MEHLEIHGYKVKYDPDDGPTVRGGIAYLQDAKKFDAKQAQDVFENARRSDDHKTKIDFYNHHEGEEQSIEIYYDGSCYRVRRAN